MRIGAIIQARYQSTRLPGKVLMPLPYPMGKPLLQHVVDAILGMQFIHYFCIATSTNQENDSIAHFADQYGIACYRGDENDVLSRFVAVSKEHELDVIIRLTGDNPLLASLQLRDVLDEHLRSGCDYSKSIGLPLGMNFEIVNAKVLREIDPSLTTIEDREHVTKFVNDRASYRKYVYKFDFPAISGIRCTVDYPSDFAMMSILFSVIEHKIDIIKELHDVMNSDAWIFDINRDNHQVKFYETFSEELPIVVPLLKRYGFVNTLEFISGKRENRF